MSATVECACCKKDVPHDFRSEDTSEGVYGLYVGMGGTMYVCKVCQQLPFIEVMKATCKGKVYVGGTPFTDLISMKKAEKNA